MDPQSVKHVCDAAVLIAALVVFALFAYWSRRLLD